MTSNAWRWIPNALTLVRIVLIVPFAKALLVQAYWFALAVFVIAALTDGLDGFLARHFNWRSRFGAVADPLADKALMVVAYLMLTYTTVLPVWLCVLVLGRDLLIVGGALVYHYRIGRFEMAPSIPGKLNTLLQMLFIVGVMVVLTGAPVQPVWFEAGIWLVAVSTIYSGCHYVVVWGSRARRSRQS